MARPVGDGRRLTGQLEGTVAIVTGAAHGLGRAIGTELAAAGATVAACDILAAELEDTRGLVAARGRTSRFAVVDVTDARQVAAFVADVSRTEGRLDILVNNAGGVAGQTGRPIDEISDQDWHQLFAINLDATFHFTRAVVPHMKARAGGSIVNISAGAGRADSLTGIQAYASAKAGVIGFTRQMARELGPYGIRVNSVAPGFLRTTPVTERQWAAMGETGQRDFLDSIALRRLGRPEDIAKAVVFFASDDAAYITGQTLGVDGGRQMFW